ncbi:ATP-dependent zinc protease [Thiohalophilus sp.]|uniref:ATP-dependent zinc protease family protein n=1 Tax=Thiohalophilus sp. TaxID=3028392 RepID=UPI002ACDF98F|nr:ATP-dependent zinc protease [Thiohalophilus sp.]MDZ7661861.1 ATP-dependent zinc protease [Thiohalophilus sp.]
MSTDKQQIIGWREWVRLPKLGIEHIKAKIDTGARSSALHTFDLEAYQEQGVNMIRFKIHPVQHNSKQIVECHCPILDQRTVTDSGGHKEERFVISTEACLGDLCWEIEMTLTNRDSMRFRMLLGRTALAGRFVVDPQASYLTGHRPAR